MTSLRVLRVLGLVVALASSLLGAVLAVLPALVVGFVTLFYNSAGKALIFLGNLIGLLPNPFGAAGGGSSLPMFQQLDTHAGAVVLGSVVATILCSTATAVIVVSAQGRSGRHWLAVGLCCVAAAIAGGRAVMLSVIPAIAISLGHLTRQQLRRR